LDIQPKNDARGWDLALADLSVTRILLDSNIVLGFGIDSEVELRIEGDIFLTGHDGGEVLAIEFDPYRSDGPKPSGLDELARLIPSTVVSSRVDLTGVLALEFSNGIRVTIEPSSRYESWTLSGRGGVYVSRPGGEIVFW
jgi:hypothetical protein